MADAPDTTHAPNAGEDKKPPRLFGWSDDEFAEIGDIHNFIDPVLNDLERRARVAKFVLEQWQDDDEVTDDMLRQTVVDLVQHVIDARDAYFALPPCRPRRITS